MLPNYPAVYPTFENFYRIPTLATSGSPWQHCFPRPTPSFFLEVMVNSREDGRVLYIRSRYVKNTFYV